LTFILTANNRQHNYSQGAKEAAKTGNWKLPTGKRRLVWN